MMAFSNSKTLSAPPKYPHTIKQNKSCSNPESQLCIKPPNKSVNSLEMYAPIATALKVTFKRTMVNTEVIKVQKDLVY